MQWARVIMAAVFVVIGALIAIPPLTRADSSSDSSRAAGTSTPTTGPSSSSKKAVTPTVSTPVQPLQVTIGRVACPSRTVKVTIKNVGARTEDYTIEEGGSVDVAGRITSGATRTANVNLREDRASKIVVTWHNEPVKSISRTANCTARTTPSPTPDESLPHTGPDTVLWARAATGLAAMVTGVIIFWYGGIWPRRRDQIFPKKPKN